MKPGKTWIVLMLKDKYSQNAEKEKLKADLMAALGYAAGEIIFTPFDREKCISYYLFLLDRPGGNDLRRILDTRPEAFDSYSSPMRITQAELDDFIKGSEHYNETKSVKFGDIVRIKTGRYCNLNGIVLRQCRHNKVDVGIKLCLGTKIIQYSPNELKVSGNIFKHIKVPT